MLLHLSTSVQKNIGPPRHYSECRIFPKNRRQIWHFFCRFFGPFLGLFFVTFCVPFWGSKFHDQKCPFSFSHYKHDMISCAHKNDTFKNGKKRDTKRDTKSDKKSVKIVDDFSRISGAQLNTLLVFNTPTRPLDLLLILIFLILIKMPTIK